MITDQSLWVFIITNWEGSHQVFIELCIVVSNIFPVTRKYSNACIWRVQRAALYQQHSQVEDNQSNLQPNVMGLFLQNTKK